MQVGLLTYIQAQAILLVESSALQRVGATVAEIVDGDIGENNENEEECVTYRKKVEPALREWIETEDCQQNIADKFFDNCPGRSCQSTMIFPHC